MRALLMATLLALAGAAHAQGGTASDPGAMCRSFCDADANKCRKEATRDAGLEVDPLVDMRNVPRADKDDGSVQRYEQAVTAAEKDRYAVSQKCGETRMACRQRCVAPAAAASTAR